MPSIYDLKLRFQALLRPLCNLLVRAGLTANQVTIAAILLSLATGALICIWPNEYQLLLLLPAVLFLRMALNAIDGMIAREHNQKTAIGAVLNELGDVISDTALYLPLAIVPGFEHWLVVAIVIGAILTEMTGVVMATLGASRRYDGPMGKSDRAFVFGAIGMLLGLGLAPTYWLTVVLAVVCVLLVLTIVNRIRCGLRTVKRSIPAPQADQI